MNRFFKNISFLFLSIFIFLSCNRLKDIEIVEINNIRFENFDLDEKYINVYLNILVDNPSHYKFKIKELELKIIADNRYIGKLLLNKPIFVLPYAKDWYTVSLNLKLMDVLSTVTIYSKYIEGKDIYINIKGHIIGKSYIFMVKETIYEEFIINSKNQKLLRPLNN